jgi:hypothetical protein
MLSTLMILAATVQMGSGWEDPHDAGTAGPWSLTCVRDGAFTSSNHVEGCSARTKVGGVQLIIVRTANEAYTMLIDPPGCAADTGQTGLSVKALNQPGQARVRLVRDALGRTIKAAAAHCRTGPELKTFVVRDSDIAAFLKVSEGLVDADLPD